MRKLLRRPVASTPGTREAFLLGWACGGRTSFGPSALALSAGPGRWSRWRSRGAVFASVGEVVVDKLPQTPSRLQPEVLGGRVVVGTASAAYLAHRERRALLPAAGYGAAGAVAGSVVGNLTRRVAARRRPDWQAAIIEDLVSGALAAWAVRRRPGSAPVPR